jgi:hypothetical protein
VRLRSAATPAAKESKRHAWYTERSGAGRTRSVSSVITANAPSEPSSSWRRSGPAADAGARPSTSSPSGVAARSPSTSWSNRP